MPKRPLSIPGSRPSHRPPATARFRDDLIVTPGMADAAGARSYLIEDPASREKASFGEEEYFLCQSMDGIATAEEILTRFEERFDAEMQLEHFHGFAEHLVAIDFARPVVPPATSPPPRLAEAPKPKKDSANPQWSLVNPARFFHFLLAFVRPFRILILLANLCLIVAIPASIFIIFRHGTEFKVDLRSLNGSLGYLGGLLFGLLAANLVRCVVQGTVCAYYDIAPEDAGIKLRRGILPRFYIDKSRVRTFDRSTKLWIYGTGILVRLYFIALGVLFWMLFKDGSSLLPSVAVMMAQTGLIGLLLQLLPLEPTDGYRWLVNYFHLPPNMLFIALKVLALRVTGKPVPATLQGAAGWRYLFYALALVVLLTLGTIKIISHISDGLNQTFPDLLGRATPYIFVALISYFIIRWAAGKFMHPQSKRSQPSADPEFPLPEMDEEPESTGFAALFVRYRAWFILLAIGAAMFIPSAYRPGGEIQVLPPIQQEIQAPVTGKVAEIAFKGGDGKLISQGDLVAKMISSELENQLLTLDQTRAQQLSTIDKLKSELAKLQSGARTEEITGAAAKLQQTVEQMSIAVQELQSAKVSAAHSAMVLPRLKKLYQSGSLALLQYEEAKTSAEIDQINVEKASKFVASLTQARDEAQAQLNLLKSGARPEDLDSARHSIEAAQADLSRIDQQIHYAQQQQTESALLMPFDGYLVDSNLDFKRGTYLKQGEIFATAQNNSQPLVEVQLPEYDMEGVEIGATTQVKLFAYPNSSLVGKVRSIQPAAQASSSSPESITRLFRVLIEVEKPPFTLKAGMTGYAKINAGFQPLGMLLARPLIRFIQIEMWSWLP